MNNYEKIKQMTVEEMAEFIDELSNSGEYTCCYCRFYNYYYEKNSEFIFQCEHNCIDGIQQWLLSEVE